MKNFMPSMKAFIPIVLWMMFLPSTPLAWELIWSDEFDGAELDMDSWNIEHVPDPYNSELQYYPDRLANSAGSNLRVADGVLTIEARAEKYAHRQFTSGRINTQGKREFTYGRFVARMKLPNGVGMWPAFWLLGGNIDEVGWPACGEIDVMEGKGRLPDWVSGALNHGSDFEQLDTIWAEYTLPEGDFHSRWHEFSVEWAADRISWYVDDRLFHQVDRPADSDSGYWPYDIGQSFFMLLNLAVGGHFDHPHMPADDMLPKQFLVDYVRVYQLPASQE